MNRRECAARRRDAWLDRGRGAITLRLPVTSPGFPSCREPCCSTRYCRSSSASGGIDLAHWQIAPPNFSTAVRPGDVLRLEHDAAGGGLIRFTVRAANRTVVSGALSNALRRGGSA